MRGLILFGFTCAFLLAGHTKSYSWYKPSNAHEAAIVRLMTDPDSVEAELSNAPTGTEKLDYILYLHAFHSQTPARDAKIRDLLSELTGLVAAKGDYFGKEDFKIHPYDGTDDSLIPSIQASSLSGVAEFDNPVYTIPCAVLRKRPSLLGAITPYFGSSGDEALPYPGCGERGSITSFPDRTVSAYRGAIGYAGDDENGTMRFGYEREMLLLNERMKLDPQHFLAAGYHPCYPPKMTKAVRLLYLAAQTDLIAYYASLGIPKTKATLVATRGLRAIPNSDDCQSS